MCGDDDNSSPYPPFGMPSYTFSVVGYPPSSIELVGEFITEINAEGGIIDIMFPEQSVFPSTPTVTVEPWTVISYDELINEMGTFDYTRIKNRMHDVLTDYVQCNVTQEEVKSLIEDTLLMLLQEYGDIPGGDR